MNRNLSVLIIFIALLPILIYIFIQPQPLDQHHFSIQDQDKQKLIAYSYQLLYNMFNETSQEQIQTPTIDKKDMNYDIFFITLLNNGTVRGCQSGSTERSNRNRLFNDIQEALSESVEDSRFGGILKENELPYVDVMFTFLYDIHWLSNKSLVFLENNIELGIHSIEILSNNTPVIFKESVPISNNYNLSYMLERLCLKANLENKCYLDDDIDLFRYETVTFKANQSLDIIDLYRYNILIDQNSITNTDIYNSIESGYQWFLHATQPSSNRLEYEYYPSINVYSLNNNDVRQLATLWSLTQLQLFFNDTRSQDIIDETVLYYQSFLNYTDSFAYLTIDNESKLANNAFLLMALLNMDQNENQTPNIDLLAKGMLSLQQDNGSYDTYFFSEKNTGTDYYPGEAMLSLMNMYLLSQNETYLQSVQKAFPYYKQYWRLNKNSAFVPWHTQTYALLYEETQDRDLADFIFEMNDWIIDSFQIQKSQYKDEIGGFPYYYPTFSTSVFLEGITDAYEIAVRLNDSFHMKKYEESIRNGTRFILQTQFTKDNTFYIENKTRAIGGFKTSLTDNTIRIDNVQHAVMALMKIYQLQLFP